jgi:3-oxoacyl-[acyl-carrier-protein] synthase-3
LDAYVAGIAGYAPAHRVTNADLARENPGWDVERIGGKVGITSRRIADPDETAADLAYAAAVRLLDGLGLDRSRVDALLFCTQSPDYLLPTTACVLQDRLGLPTSCAALDFNQGCSGYVYGLALAKGMVAAGIARNVLLLTADTYSKLIHPQDRSVRMLFGDAASASLVTAEPGGARVGALTLGTDGAGYRNLIVPAGGARCPRTPATAAETTDEAGSTRSAEHLFMDGPELFAFTLKRVPELVRETLERGGLAADAVDWFVFHQANAFMNEHLRSKLRVPKDKAPLRMADLGNTVSSTIPLTLCDAGASFEPGHRVMLVGFGVGYSWGAALLDWGRVALFDIPHDAPSGSRPQAAVVD